MDPTEPNTDSPPRKLPWFQYSLRTLLMVMVFASIAMSWLVVKMQQALPKCEIKR